MDTNEKILIAVLGLGVAAIVLYQRKNTIAPPDALATGSIAPFANMPPETVAGAIYMQNTAPWGSVPPVTPMINRSSGIMGVSSGGSCVGSRCG